MENNNPLTPKNPAESEVSEELLSESITSIPPQPAPEGRCCDNGTFGEDHDCQKQPGEPAPEPSKCSRCEGTGFRYSDIAQGYTNEACRHCGGTGIEPAPDSPDELMEILEKWGRAAMDVLIEPRISPADLMAAKNEAHAAITKLIEAAYGKGYSDGKRDWSK